MKKNEQRIRMFFLFLKTMTIYSDNPTVNNLSSWLHTIELFLFLFLCNEIDDVNKFIRSGSLLLIYIYIHHMVVY
jgi:hypothetical protein